jgi:hypothetical protein
MVLEQVGAEIVSILRYRKTARLEGNTLIPCTPEESDGLP